VSSKRTNTTSSFELVALAIESAADSFDSPADFDAFYEQVALRLAVNYRADVKRLGSKTAARKRYDEVCAKAWRDAEAVAAEGDAALAGTRVIGGAA
jgi:hypothetical protein